MSPRWMVLQHHCLRNKIHQLPSDNYIMHCISKRPTLRIFIHHKGSININHKKNFVFADNFDRFSQFLPCDAMRCTVLVIVILSVCPPVRPSVCHTRALCPHGSTYDHDFFTIWLPHHSNFWGYHAHPKIRRGSPRARALNESGVGTNWRFATNKPPYLQNGARYDKGYY